MQCNNLSSDNSESERYFLVIKSESIIDQVAAITSILDCL